MRKVAVKRMGKQHPIPDWLKVPFHMEPEQLRRFRKFLKVIHKMQKKRAALGE